MKTPFAIGTRVLIPASPDENLPEERGVVLEYYHSTQCYLIKLDLKYFSAAEDDGERLVGSNYVFEEKKCDYYSGGPLS